MARLFENAKSRKRENAKSGRTTKNTKDTKGTKKVGKGREEPASRGSFKHSPVRFVFLVSFVSFVVVRSRSFVFSRFRVFVAKGRFACFPMSMLRCGAREENHLLAAKSPAIGW